METPGTMELKDVRQKLIQQKELRVQKLVQFGELAHQKMLQQHLHDQELAQQSFDVLNLDKEIYRLAKLLVEASANQANCMKCQQAITSDVKFCGKCGQLNPSFVDASVVLKACHTCQEAIEQHVAYCPCCGVQQGGL